MNHPHTNRLSKEKSPYLLQHAHNPVDWFPWGDEAFEKARAEIKPVLLSIGYSTCHWCHVMERECFENEEVARLMNETVVAIKVDREERPDVDALYMKTVMLTTGHGGWPLNVFLTPDKKPFHGGTYYPPQPRHGMPSFPQLLGAIGEAWKNRRSEVEASAGKLVNLLLQTEPAASETSIKPDLEPVLLGAQTFRGAFDSRHGGFGRAPKFPRPSTLTFLLRASARLRWNGQKNAADETQAMVEKTLDEMARGGMHDQLGGGFHRYSVDERWLVPHFEKMLYDQALLLSAYVEAWQLTKKSEYAGTMRDIVECVLRDLTHPDGGFFSGEDADSEGVEGKFWVFTDAEFREVIGGETADQDRLALWFGVIPAGNFEHGLNILHQPRRLDDFLIDETVTAEEFLPRAAAAKAKLFAHREKRIRPHRDDKVLSGWNGLMIAALARAGGALGEPRWIAAAEKAMAFIERNLTRNGRLLRTWRDGEGKIGAFLEDHAAIGLASLELYQATFAPAHLRRAREAAKSLLARFWDDARGGFFDSADDAEALLVRQKESYDGATPAGNSLAAAFLLKLGRLTGQEEFTRWGEKCVAAFYPALAGEPTSHPEMLQALDFSLGPVREIVIAGDPGAAETKSLLSVVRQNWQPNSVIALRPVDPQALEEISALIPFIKQQLPPGAGAWAFVCENQACQKPVNSDEELRKLLG
jgi:hypothetical protein